MTAFHHVTVLPEATVAFLAPRDGGVYVDCTLGGGGHAERLLELSSPTGIVIGLDRDEVALAAARARLGRFGDRLVTVHAEFEDVADVLARYPALRPTLEQQQTLATLMHLCGAGAAAEYARRSLTLAAGQRCGDHDARGYVARVASMQRRFKSLAEED